MDFFVARTSWAERFGRSLSGREPLEDEVEVLPPRASLVFRRLPPAGDAVRATSPTKRWWKSGS
jgi:hypothetical protein